MAHYSSTKTAKRNTPPEWLAVGASIGKIANTWAERSDLVAYVGEGAGVDKGAPAIFNPDSAEIEVSVPLAFGLTRPEDVGDMTERRQQFEFPKASGAIFHEAMHARFSTWDLRKAASELPRPVVQALHLLEESRIEAYGVRVRPENRSFLRACALEIVLGDITEDELVTMTSTRQAAHILGLTYSRIDAGVLEHSDIAPLRPVIESVLPHQMIADLREIWREFQTLVASLHEARMYELAYEWEQILSERTEETGESEEQQASEEFIKQLAEALEEASGSASIGAMMDAGEQQTREEYDATASAKQASAEERAKHKSKASKVFGKGSQPTTAGSRSELVGKRAPTADERVSAVRIGQALEKAKYRDRVRIESASTTPPGRLRTRALVQGEAYRERGIVQEVEPFQRVQRKHVDDPHLTIGVMVDISGSMMSAMKPMASAAWILSEATRRVQGKVAMVYYGNGVFPTLKPGQHLTDVNVYTAVDMTEKFDDAFQALNGALELLDGSGARLLVIVSDGEYTSEERSRAKRWIKRCGQSGVGVLWLGAGSYGANASRYCNGKDAVFTRLGSSTTDAADEIGRAAIKALNAASASRNA